MFTNSNGFSLRGGIANEDAIYYDANLLILMDAATGLNKINYTSEATDGHWFSKNAVKQLSAYFISNKPEFTKNGIIDSISRITVDLKKTLDTIGYADKPNDYPSGSLVIVRINNQRLQIYSLGDCTIKLNFKGSYITLHDNSVTMLDNQVLDWLQKEATSRNLSIRDLLPSAKNLLLKNRNLRNTENGYWIYDPSGIGISKGIYQEYSIDKLTNIALMSDGFACIQDVKSLNDAELFNSLKNTSLDKMVKNLYTILENDSDFMKYPRFKKHDDSSVIYAEK